MAIAAALPVDVVAMSLVNWSFTLGSGAGGRSRASASRQIAFHHVCGSCCTLFGGARRPGNVFCHAMDDWNFAWTSYKDQT